jgi:CRISPR-associated protein Cmr2
MSEFVLILSLGPVQGFIAAARRSRDLWSGSWLLSEISKATAKALRDRGARLIFPAPDSDLTPGSEFSVGNKVQAVVALANDDEVRQLAATASEAARRRFREIAEGARNELKAEEALRHGVWSAQIDDYVEAFAAWARIHEAGYGEAAGRAGEALAARKATREFRPSAASAEDEAGFGLPKSSLDGARETVLREGKIAHRVRRKLSLSGSEQLDCAGLAKRLGGRIDQFTPYSRIAAQPWIAALPCEVRQAIGKDYGPLVALDLATRVSGNAGCYALLPYDGQLVYRFRLEAALRDAIGTHDSEGVVALERLRDGLKPIWKKYGEPCPYGVILLADGDRMGKLLGEANDENHHVRITTALSAFAGSVRERVREFDGHAIYAGGDDVLAFLPLERAFACAESLQRAFAEALQPVARDLKVSQEAMPTLSVGLAIGHLMEPLGTLRALATQAEKKAKGDELAESRKRNALGIALRVRSGSVTHVRLRWDDPGALEDFAFWQKAYRYEQGKRDLPSRLAYDARQVHQRTAFALAGDKPQPGIPAAEFARLLDRARGEDGKRLGEEIVARLEGRLAALYQNHFNLATLADELIVARWLAARTAGDLGGD